MFIRFVGALFLFLLGGGSLIEIGTEPLSKNGDDYKLDKRSIAISSSHAKRMSVPVTWDPKKTAVIVCDVWDYHHCLNAVRRLDEMLPRMEAFLQQTRKLGSVIIHAPSDCMPTYANHNARKRAEAVTKRELPKDIASWCSKIELEQGATYPLDQSDGGEDDDPAEHASWAAKLTELGRNPAMPWNAQSPRLTISAQHDYISDRGEEVWAILRERNIEHVFMIGVHTNMCVLGRPFGLRQLVRHGIDVVLVRDLTDCMYNPKRWPFVDHFTGNDLLIEYIERHICPTVSSDEVLGGQAIKFLGDNRVKRVLQLADVIMPRNPLEPEWMLVNLNEQRKGKSESSFVRCAVRFPDGTFVAPVRLKTSGKVHGAWLNGKPLDLTSEPGDPQVFEIRLDQTFGNDDANILVLDCGSTPSPPTVVTALGETTLRGGWQLYQGSAKAETNIPLPAKFGLSPEIFHVVK